jgi:hypothetical protein
MQMTEEYRSVHRLARHDPGLGVEEIADPPDPGPGIENECRAAAIVRDGET